MLKIPPPVIVLILVVSNFLSSKKIDIINIPNQTLVSIIILLIGVFILIVPVSKFIKSKTTVNPIKFKKVNKLITSGIYKYSRNPMYLGLLMVIISTSIFFLTIISITTPFIFYFWINRFQIKREEIFLTKKFGQKYITYKSKTRKWI
jgi:protein-S-isoprenylcysteine O-methyltransferase Ste14